MERIVDTQHDEWAVTLGRPEQLARFRHFANAEDKDPVPMITVRSQDKPALWLPEYPMPELETEKLEGIRQWVELGSATSVPRDGGATFLYGRHQIAVFNFAHRNAWYGCKNLCPHKQEIVLSHG